MDDFFAFLFGLAMFAFLMGSMFFIAASPFLAFAWLAGWLS